MDKLKFRGKSLRTGDWVQGPSILNQNGQSFINGYTYGFLTADDIKRGFCEVDPKTVGRFSGVYTHDNKEIYADDILLYRTDAGPMVYGIVVDYGYMMRIEAINGDDEGNYDVTLSPYMVGTKSGNIYDDVEKLEKIKLTQKFR